MYHPERVVLVPADNDPRRRALPSVDGYVLHECLGQGGMGTVYRARAYGADRDVALKMLTQVDGAGIYRLKREFRILADIAHPNLVKLFDLRCDDEHCFFTMELVRGEPFMSHLKVESGRALRAARPDHDAKTEPSMAPAVHRTHAGRSATFDATRDAFRQLAEGVLAIHRAAMVHCDIKPSNVMIDHSGRVVLLDFGVSVGFGRHSQTPTIEGEIAGTPEYMSPEQAAGQPFGPASDWYSVGVVLYEALCQQLPFSGSPFSVMRRKQSETPPRPRELNGDVPPDLEDLCMALLQAEPSLRPGGADVLDRLRAAAPASAPRSAEVPVEAVFVGRARELSSLGDALRAVGPSKPVVALVSGPSGIGKSALVDTFVAQASRDAACVVLKGRCFERESVPFKAVDPIIDEVSRLLRRLGDAEVAALLPRDISALTRVFPVLKRINAINVSAGRPADDSDLVELRRRATVALREFFTRISDARTLLVCIDDAQWGDVDSARLLRSLLEAPDPPAILLVLSARPDSDSPLLAEFLGADRVACELRRIELTELDAEEATALASGILANESRDLAPVVAREAQGSPFFVRELAMYANRHAQWEPSVEIGTERASIRLEPVLRERVTGLPTRHRQALELVVVAARPVPQSILSEALGEPPSGPASFWHELREWHLVRMVHSGDAPCIECYHDRVREAVLGLLSPARLVECHRLLANALRGALGVDPEILLEHYRDAGDDAAAQEHVLTAAAAASKALAFARAVKLYRLAFEMLPPQRIRELNLWRELARALANEGLLEEAARAYEKSADSSSGLEAIELRRLAAQHFLTSGHQERGLLALRRVLSDVGLSLPETTQAALVRLAFERARLRLLGLRFRERTGQTPLEKAQVDICFSGAAGLAVTDLLRSAAFSAQHLNLALRLGDPGRIARALAFEIGVAPGAGEEGLRWANRALPVVERLSERHGTDYHRALFYLAQGHVAYFSGQWQSGVDWMSRADRLLRELPAADVYWAFQAGRSLSSICSVAAGNFVEAGRWLSPLMEDCRRRGDIHRMALVAYPGVMLELARDRTDLARDLLEEIARPTPSDPFDLRDFTTLHCALIIDRYSDREHDTWKRISECWASLERSKLLFVNVVRITILAERGSAALGRASGRDGHGFRRLASRCAQQLEREHLPHADALAGLLRARMAMLSGDVTAGLARLARASTKLESAGLTAHAHCARRVSGTITGGRMGQLMVSECDDWLRSQGVAVPERFAAMMIPGFTATNMRKTSS